MYGCCSMQIDRHYVRTYVRSKAESANMLHRSVLSLFIWEQKRLANLALDPLIICDLSGSELCY